MISGLRGQRAFEFTRTLSRIEELPQSIENALTAQGLSYSAPPKKLPRLSPNLLRQQAAGYWMKAAELDVGAYRHRFIGNYPYRCRYVAARVRVTLSGLPSDN